MRQNSTNNTVENSPYRTLREGRHMGACGMGGGVVGHFLGVYKRAILSPDPVKNIFLKKAAVVIGTDFMFLGSPKRI